VRFIVDADSPTSSTDVHLTPKADIAEREQHVRFVPEADSCSAANYAALGTDIA
jgi:hypothetical protein